MSDSKGYRILIVDDEASVAQATSMVLATRGFITEVASSGRDALEKIAVGHYDLVILDLCMPELSGWNVLRVLREEPETLYLPVIVLSARVTTSDIVKGLELGANDYCMKPADFDELAARVQRHIEVHKAAGAVRTAKDDCTGEPACIAWAALEKVELPLQQILLTINIARGKADENTAPFIDRLADLAESMQDTVLEAAGMIKEPGAD